MKTEFVYNPFLPGMIADPYPTYRRLRETDPVHYSDVIRSWVLTRYDDVAAALSDPRLSSDRTKARKYRGVRRNAGGTFQTDPPQHTRIRSFANKVFGPKTFESIALRVESIVEDLLDRLGRREHVDIIEDFAYPLPMTVISEIIGAPSSDHATFQRWGRGLAPTIDHTFSGRNQSGVGAEMGAYFANLVPERRAHPRNDLVTALIDVTDEEGDRLTDAEIMEILIFLLFAGHETTVNLIGNGLLSLLRQPDQLARVRDEDLSRKCVEELLRYESPAQIIARTVGEDLEWDGHAFRAGDALVGLLGAANRDPDKFDDPETLDVARTPNPHVAFGHGPHFCLGAQLSRLEGRVALPALLRRFPRMRLVDDAPDWRQTAVLRGLNSLVVTLA